MRVGKLAVVLLTGVLCLIGGARAQFNEGGRTPDHATAGHPPEAEFHMGRLAYYALGCAGSRGWCNPWWAIDYPLAEAHFLPALARMTRVQVADDSRAVTLDDDALFDYPWIILQQPGRGEWHPHGEQAARLREYLMRGGFLVVDDFHDEYEWASFQSAMQEVLPDRPIIDMSDDHPIFHVVFDLPEMTKVQIPNANSIGWGGRGGMRGTPRWRGVEDANGRLVILIAYNNDVMDGWQWADDPRYPGDKANLALRLGVNVAMYSMTH